MHPEHVRLLDDIRKAGRPATVPPSDNVSYGSSGRITYYTTVPQRRAIARRWAHEHRSAAAAEVLSVVESLLAGDSLDERTLATSLLAYHQPAREAVRPQDAARWLGSLNGWAEVDGLCQSLFPAE